MTSYPNLGISICRCGFIESMHRKNTRIVRFRFYPQYDHFKLKTLCPRCKADRRYWPTPAELAAAIDLGWRFVSQDEPCDADVHAASFNGHVDDFASALSALGGEDIIELMLTEPRGMPPP